MTPFSDIFGLRGLDRRAASAHDDARSGALRERPAGLVSVLDGRAMAGDVLVGALRQSLSGVRVRKVAQIDDIDPGEPQVIVFSLLGRSYDLALLDRVLDRLGEQVDGLPLVILADGDVPPRQSTLSHVRWVDGSESIEAAASVVTQELARLRAEQRGSAREPRLAVAGERRHKPLSSRECHIFRLVHEGKPNKIIAHELGISESTVKVHLRSLMAKMRVNNRTQLALLWETTARN